jgi:hypothetical protein
MRSRVLLVVLAILLVAGLLQVLHVRFEGNDLVPEYSSLRYDPRGLSVVFESLEATGALQVSRSNRPLGMLRNNDATLLIAGADRFSWLDSESTIEELEKLARQGDRVVIALANSVSRFQKIKNELLEKWGVRVLAFPPRDHQERDHEDEADTLPRWPAYFLAGSDWRILDSDRSHALVIARKFDSGSVVLLASAWPLTNEAMVQDRRSGLLAGLLSEKPKVVFDESHLGMEESGTVMALTRTFHLQGFLVGLLLLACLFVWRNLASFPPERSVPETRTGRDSLTGLSILLSRNVPENRVIEMCLAERQKSGEKRLRFDQLQRAQLSGAHARNPLEWFEAIRSELHTSRKL